MPNQPQEEAVMEFVAIMVVIAFPWQGCIHLVPYRTVGVAFIIVRISYIIIVVIRGKHLVVVGVFKHIIDDHQRPYDHLCDLLLGHLCHHDYHLFEGQLLLFGCIGFASFSLEDLLVHNLVIDFEEGMS